MIRARIAVLLVVFGGAGCGDATRAQVLIEVDAEPGVRAEARSLLVLVRVGSGPDALEQDPSFRQEIDGPEWPRTFALAPRDGDASRAFAFHAIARDLGGNLVAETRLIRGYSAGRIVRVRLLLEDRCRGIVCEPTERCEAGECVKADMPVEMPDGGVPDPDAGPPAPCVLASDCDDGIFCNGVETCAAGLCALGAIQRCDDGLECTRDRCDAMGCAHDPDASFCTAVPGGICDPLLGCQYSTCTASTCMPSATECRGATCMGTTCVRDPLCAPGQFCCAGRCEPAGCDDDNPCTNDACGMAGCVHEDNTSPCDDGDVCSNGDVCAFRVCRGTPVECNDLNPCTVDGCDGMGGCAHTPDPMGTCDDAMICTNDFCIGGECRSVPIFCDDGIACTHDSCRPATGTCMSVPDDTLCTAGPSGTCEVATGGCQYGPTCTPTLCMPTSGCEMASCVGADCIRDSICGPLEVCCAGSCAAPGCEDGNPCTDDSCGAGGCRNFANTLPCDDGNPCTPTDQCSGGSCVGSGGMSCDDGDQCTMDACGGGGCTHVRVGAGVPCNDSLDCTINDRCRGGGACRGDPMDCSDVEQCTSDSCAEGVGCQHLPSGGPCEDGNVCTEGDMCTGTFCSSGPECPGPGTRICSGGICIDIGAM